MTDLYSHHYREPGIVSVFSLAATMVTDLYSHQYREAGIVSVFSLAATIGDRLIFSPVQAGGEKSMEINYFGNSPFRNIAL